MKSIEEFEEYILHLQNDDTLDLDSIELTSWFMNREEMNKMNLIDTERFKTEIYRMYQSNELTLKGLLKVMPLIAAIMTRIERSNKLIEYE